MRTEAEMLEFGEKLGKKLLAGFLKSDAPVVIELVGDVGAGKTTLTRGLAKGLGIKEQVTSPSFTISKRYKFESRKAESELSSEAISSAERPRACRGRSRSGLAFLAHYDFYRLSDPGIMVEDFAETVQEKNTVTVVEWGESVKDLLPEGHLRYEILYRDDGTREIKESK